MMSFLQTGKALYVLAAICLAGVFSRLMAGSFYKRLIKESTNMALTKNKCLRNLKQNAEDTYRINQGMSNTRVYLERQMYSLRTAGMTARGLDNLSGQLTLLCFLAGGGQHSSLIGIEVIIIILFFTAPSVSWQACLPCWWITG